jgi:hypothetical protein
MPGLFGPSNDEMDDIGPRTTSSLHHAGSGDAKSPEALATGKGCGRYVSAATAAISALM